ncbi:MAG: imidazoleglycerol-phosphate dehydratase HisB [Candidatus Manganitrophus sp.]|nr:imidazoleglycerol-phosphate dehydratase HisB [Candidatus Manganitrophus sp.]MDC4223659.1 imidazoleglycerol-phosphate dehydratase HisB [Candidatus Manganitrophus sp.]WDT70057.1 MAG: imidazoleglycerol-phosphate dehydratase HisB [Candidatus Manganitrophus sp.]WDT78291.1 MAG: imidazoleglycerol-phosphate dehydratase HisB [Candidatus Manganitrophus sp.]
MRRTSVRRETKETQITIQIDLDGSGKYQVETPFPFLNHMLSAFAKHGYFDLTVKAKGDVEIDDHHTVEDIGIVLGEALAKAWGEKRGIRRFGHASIPLDEALAEVTVDLSGRPYLVYQVQMPKKKIKEFDTDLVEHFFRAVVDQCKINLHINLHYGKDPHHILEAIFKGFGRALDAATQIDPRLKGVASTKGKL